MTIATTTSRVDVLGNGSAIVFSFAPIVIFEASDLQVTLRDASGNETALAQGGGSTNYSVNVVSYPGTGSIVYPASGGTPLASGSKLVIKRIVPLLQSVALENQGAYFANIQEGAFDYAMAVDQQQQEQINRTVQVAPTDPPVPVTLPTSAARANQLLGFDSAGNPIAAVTLPVGIVSTAMQPVVDAATTSSALALLGGATISQAVSALAAGVAFVSSLTSLRALTSSANTQSVAYMSGCNAPGDGGEGLFFLVASDTTTADDGGTVIVDASGRRWYRDYQNQTVKLLWWGGNAQLDYAPALTSALALATRLALANKPGMCIEFPAQTLSFSSAVTYNYPSNKPFSLTLKGVGAGATVLNWVATNGLVFNMSQPTHTIHVWDMSITTSSVNTYTAVTCNQSSPQSWFDQNDFVRVTFRGADATNLSNLWATAVTVNALGNINFDGCLFWGKPNGTGASLGVGVSLTGNTGLASPFGIVYNFTNCSFWELNDCIIYGTDVQGVTLEACNVTNCVTGVFVPGTAVNGCQLGILNCQFNCFSNAVLIAGVMNNLQFTNNLVLIVASNSTGIGITGTCIYHNITGNQFSTVGSVSNTNGVYLNGSVSFAVITGNIFAGLTTGVALSAATSNNNVQANAYNSCTTKVANLGTNNSVGVATQ